MARVNPGAFRNLTEMHAKNKQILETDVSKFADERGLDLADVREWAPSYAEELKAAGITPQRLTTLAQSEQFIQKTGAQMATGLQGNRVLGAIPESDHADLAQQLIDAGDSPDPASAAVDRTHDFLARRHPEKYHGLYEQGVVSEAELSTAMGGGNPSAPPAPPTSAEISEMDADQADQAMKDLYGDGRARLRD